MLGQFCTPLVYIENEISLGNNDSVSAKCLLRSSNACGGVVRKEWNKLIYMNMIMVFLFKKSQTDALASKYIYLLLFIKIVTITYLNVL